MWISIRKWAQSSSSSLRLSHYSVAPHTSYLLPSLCLFFPLNLSFKKSNPFDMLTSESTLMLFSLTLLPVMNMISFFLHSTWHRTWQFFALWPLSLSLPSSGLQITAVSPLYRNRYSSLLCSHLPSWCCQYKNSPCLTRARTHTSFLTDSRQLPLIKCSSDHILCGIRAVTRGWHRKRHMIVLWCPHNSVLLLYALKRMD